jgi:hypothetical protein
MNGNPASNHQQPTSRALEGARAEETDGEQADPNWTAAKTAH